MQNLYDRIPTENRKTRIEGSVFIKRQVSKLTAMQLAVLDYRAWQYRRFAVRLWLVLAIGSFVLWIGSDLIGTGVFEHLTVLFGLYFFFGVPVTLAIMELVFAVRRIRQRRKLNEFFTRANQELGIPEDAEELEIIHPVCGDSSGWMNGNHKGLVCHNHKVRMFLEENNLCLADYSCVMEIPLSSLHNISPTAIKGRMTRWLQKKGPRSRKFRKYKVKYYTANNYIILFHEIRIHDPAGDYCFCVPNYELPKLCALTKLRLYDESFSNSDFTGSTESVH